MHLIIHADGRLEKIDKLTQHWIDYFEAGLITIVKFLDNEIFTLQEDGLWLQI